MKDNDRQINIKVEIGEETKIGLKKFRRAIQDAIETINNISPPSTLDEDIALAFAKHYPIESHRILAAKDILRSWESIEALCEFTLAYGYSDPYHCIGLFLDTPEGQTFRAAYNKSLRSE